MKYIQITYFDANNTNKGNHEEKSNIKEKYIYEC